MRREDGDGVKKGGGRGVKERRAEGGITLSRGGGAAMSCERKETEEGKKEGTSKEENEREAVINIHYLQFLGGGLFSLTPSFTRLG
ncbi:hypothetical protein Pcinc_013545 [Petrolisthes cinctipes]|uniref:Uncharacterized protein n=1 Tax=Petrolisthes cinctipes TaxID=88211 RepID=A0AAE1FZL7_PETCI|nr:hypothetical protein Pcinc_013545 [Petrolisthes cinctipes]